MKRHTLSHRLEQCAELGFALPQILVGPLSLGNVPDDAREEVLLAGLPCGNGQLYRKLVAAFVASHQLERLTYNALPSSRQQPLQPVFMRLPKPFGHDRGKLLADHLVSAVAEHRFGGAVPEHYPARFVNRNDGVGGRLHD